MRQSIALRALLTLFLLFILPSLSKAADQNNRSSLITTSDSKRFSSDFIKPYSAAEGRFSTRQSITTSRVDLNKTGSAKSSIVPAKTEPVKVVAPVKQEISKEASPTKKEEASKEEKAAVTPKKTAASTGGSNPQATGFAANLGATKVNVEPFTGSASTAVPIEVPPGRAGIQPNLMLTYNSSGGYGMFGVGWNMDIGAIERSTKKGVPKYDNSDQYVLMMGGSQELVFDPATNRYYSEVEGAFNKIERVGDNWVITDKKGTKYHFGQTHASRVSDPANSNRIFRWALDKVEDLQGNYMTITYAKDNGQIYPERIDYTGNTTAGLPTYARVEFVRSQRLNAAITSYRSGFKVRTEWRIEQINVYADGKKQGEYAISYGLSGATNRNLIRAVRFYGADGASALPPVQFSYNENKPQFQLASGWNIPSDLMLNMNYQGRAVDAGVRFIDLDGDCYVDLIRRVTTRENIFSTKMYSYAYSNDKGNGWRFTDKWNIPTDTGAYFIVHLDSYDNVDQGVRIADFNGDGFQDFAQSSWLYDANGNRLSKTRDNFFINSVQGVISKDSSWKTPDSVAFYGQKLLSLAAYMGGYISTGVIIGDVNSDGISDLVQSAGSERGVYINQFYQGSKSFNSNSSYNIPSNNYTDFTQGATLVDLNSDGLSDIFYRKDGQSRIFMNTGNGWVEDSASGWNQYAQFGSTTDKGTQMVDINGDGLVDMVVTSSGDTANAKFLINTGEGWNLYEGPIGEVNFFNYSTQFMDANADGMIDYLNYSYDQSPKLYINQSKTADLLIGVNNGVGGLTSLEYDSSAHYQNKFLPFPLQVVKSVTTSNSRGDSYTARYSYEGGLWDAVYREFAGFEKVKVIDADGNYSETTYDQRHYYKGRAIKQESYDAQGRLLKKSVNEWGEQNIAQTTPQVKFIFLKRTDNYIYDYPAAGRRTAQAMIYDQSPQYGDATRVINYGEVNLTTGEDLKIDDTTVSITSYLHNTDRWLMSLPNESVVHDASGKKLAGTVFYYDGSESHMATPQKGLLTKKRIEVVALEDASAIGDVVTKYEYDDIGNIIKTVDPKGNATSVEYDPTYRMFPVKVTNPIGQSSSSVYYGVNAPVEEGLYKGLWGQLKSTTDANGQKSETIYDSFGRTVKVIGPLDTADNPTAQTFYQEFPDYVKVSSKVLADRVTGKTIDAVAFYDGIGRLIQQKSKSVKAGQYVVGGQVQYNNRGLAWKSYPSYFTNNDLDTIDPINPNLPYSEAQYDAQGRMVKSINPDGSYVSVLYDGFNVETINENGHKSRSQYDVFGRLINKMEYTGADGRNSNYTQSAYTEYAKTDYKYDIKGNLVEVKDAKGNITSISYDSLGRKIAMNDPDMGYWQYGYDANGNLAWQVDNKQKRVTFAYDKLNRLLNKNDTGLWSKRQDSKMTAGVNSPMPMTAVSPNAVTPLPNAAIPAMPTVGRSEYFNVDYGYDDPNMGFAKGRLTHVQYSQDYAQFYYDQLGREIKSLKKVDDRIYKVERQYDTLNRLTDLQYPDDSHVYYNYNDVGQIQSVRATAQDIVKNVEYNAQGQTNSIEYGNGVVTRYSYDPKMLRLTQYMTYSAAGDLVQWFQYQYDGIGQIIAITDKVHTASQTFKYDSINRLLEAKGNYGTKVYKYDEIGNILEKDGATYIYGGTMSGGYKAGPHAVTSVREANGEVTSYQYDQNGNMSVVDELTKSKKSFYIYDGENRLREVKVEEVSGKSRVLSQYFYDGDGGRVKKVVYKNNQFADKKIALGGQVGLVPLTAVAMAGPMEIEVSSMSSSCDRNSDCVPIRSQEMTVRLPQVPATPTGEGIEVTRFVGNLYEEVGDRKTKFIYLGGTRVASVTGDEVMYYHTDHLGGLNVLTDKAGMVRQLVEYESFGQISKQEKYGNDFATAWYYFTGKPVDDETGLMYYGARYYNPKLGRFITPDTIIPNPARPQSLNRYSYCENNPVNFTDPTGHKKKSWWKKAWNYFTSNTIVGGFIQAVQTGNWGQFGRQVAVMAISAAATLLLPGSGALASNLFMNVGLHAVRGAAIGAVTGGLSSVIMGGTFADGARLGAIVGGITGAMQGVTTSEQFGNWRAGNGFKSNSDVSRDVADRGYRVARLAGQVQTDRFQLNDSMTNADLVKQINRVPSVEVRMVSMGGVDSVMTQSPSLQVPSVGELFLQELSKNPPVVGMSSTALRTTLSVSTAGVSYAIDPTQLIGQSVFIQSSATASNTFVYYSVPIPAGGPFASLTVGVNKEFVVQVGAGVGVGRKWGGSHDVYNSSL